MIAQSESPLNKDLFMQQLDFFHRGVLVELRKICSNDLELSSLNKAAPGKREEHKHSIYTQGATQKAERDSQK